jgi:hypothetical protein
VLTWFPPSEVPFRREGLHLPTKEVAQVYLAVVRDLCRMAKVLAGKNR